MGINSAPKLIKKAEHFLLHVQASWPSSAVWSKPVKKAMLSLLQSSPFMKAVKLFKELHQELGFVFCYPWVLCGGGTP